MPPATDRARRAKVLSAVSIGKLDPSLKRDSVDAALNAVQEAARICGDVANRYFRQGLPVEWKSDGSEVTRADREAEATAREWIDQRFPDDGIVGEELGVERNDGRTALADRPDRRHQDASCAACRSGARWSR